MFLRTSKKDFDLRREPERMVSMEIDDSKSLKPTSTPALRKSAILVKGTKYPTCAVDPTDTKSGPVYLE